MATVRLLCIMTGTMGTFYRGDILTVTEREAKTLIQAGYAERVSALTSSATDEVETATAEARRRAVSRQRRRLWR